MLPAKFKLTLYSFFLIFGFSFFVTKAFAQGAPYPLNTNSDVPQDLHTYTQTVIIELASMAVCQIAGYDPIDPSRKCLGVDSETNKIGYVQNGGGLIGIAGNMIAMTFEIPISSTHYAKYIADNFRVTKSAYAQEGGIGFEGLKPLLTLWKSFRNIAYLAFVILFVVIGLAIMFRIKIDPRTVMTIQNQIPKVIIALVLVTFSYAIAGFLIDIMYVLMYLVFNVFAPIIGNTGGINPQDIQGSNPLTAVGALGGLGMAYRAATGAGDIIASLFDGTYARVFSSLIGLILGGGGGFALGGPWGAAIGGAVGAVGGLIAGSEMFRYLGGFIAFLVIAIAILSALFRLWFQLLKAYIFVLINVVLAPFFIAYGLIPGRSGFGGWIRSLVANLSVFPATLLMLLLGKVFMEAFGNTTTAQPFVPPFIGNPGNQKSFAALIGVGIILLTPEVVNIIKEALKAPDFKFASGIGRSLGVGAGVVGAGPKGAWSGLMRHPRYLGDPGGPLYARLSEFQQEQDKKGRVAGKVLSFLGFHGHGTSGGPSHG